MSIYTQEVVNIEDRQAKKMSSVDKIRLCECIFWLGMSASIVLCNENFKDLFEWFIYLQLFELEFYVFANYCEMSHSNGKI